MTASNGAGSSGESRRRDRLPIVQYWHAADPPGYIVELLETFPRLNPERPHLVFDRPSAARFIAERFGPRRLDAFQACAIPAMQADYFRYCATLALGGAFFDADGRCVKNVDSLIPGPGEARLFRRPGMRNVVNGIYGFGSSGHPLLSLTVEIATANIERRLANVFAAAGPLIFTTLHDLLRLGSFDALREHMVGRRYEAATAAICEVVADFERVERAFEGVGVSLLSNNVWLRAPERPMPYKSTSVHWVRAAGEDVYEDAMRS